MHLQISRLWPHGERFPSMRYSAPLSPCPFTFKRCSVTPAHANTRGSLTQERISIGLLPWRLTIRICMRKKISCSFYLRTWKNLNKNQLTSLLKLGWFFLRFPSRFMAILCFFFSTGFLPVWTDDRESKTVYSKTHTIPNKSFPIQTFISEVTQPCRCSYFELGSRSRGSRAPFCC